MENPNLKWMRTGAAPVTQETTILEWDIIHAEENGTYNEKMAPGGGWTPK